MANNYDRIFKENIELLLLPLLKKLLGLSPPKLSPIDAKMQVTQEAEMDHIRRVVHDNPEKIMDYKLNSMYLMKICGSEICYTMHFSTKSLGCLCDKS